MATKTEINEQQIALIKPFADGGTIALDSTLKSLGINDLDQVEFLMEVEEKFKVSFSNDVEFIEKSIKEMTNTLVEKTK